jgi:hypothetical protein
MFLWICQKASDFRHVVRLSSVEFVRSFLRSFVCLLSSVYKDRKVPALSSRQST